MGTPDSRRPVPSDREANRSGQARPLRRSWFVRFTVLFLVLMLAFSALLSTDVADEYLHDPLEQLLAMLSAPVLSLLGETAHNGNRLAFQGFQAVVVEECNGVLPTYIYISAVLAFPSGWRLKGLGILLGVPTVFVINLVRVISLMILGGTWPTLFEEIHIYVWQAIMIAITVAIWVFWAERFVRPRLTSAD